MDVWVIYVKPEAFDKGLSPGHMGRNLHKCTTDNPVHFLACRLKEIWGLDPGDVTLKHEER